MADYKQIIILRNDLGMSRGKLCSQAAHASVAIIEKVSTRVFNEWKSQGMKKVVLKVGSKKELLELFEQAKKLFPASLIKDAGLTQIKSGEPTCIAIGPAEEKELDKLSGKLKLL